MDKPVVGIDLGTSNSVIAVIEENRATVIPDRNGRRVHPSVVSFHPNGTVLVGHEAKRRRIIDPKNTIYSAKRLIGRTFRSEAVQSSLSRLPYKIVEGDNQQPLVIVRNNEYTIPELSAFVLRHLKSIAEEHLGHKIGGAVITVPANFDDGQREATRAAGAIAGMNVLRVLNEPTAAALSYGFGRSMSTRLAIYDFGGGTFDITCLQLNDRVFEVLSTAGDTFLGGDDIDECIVEHMVNIFLQQTRVDLRYNVAAMARLRSVGEQIKCQLSSRPKAVVQVQEIAYGEGGQPLDLSFTLTADEVNHMSRELIQRSFLICDEALKLAEMASTQIDDVVLVGGTTKMPVVRQSVEHYFGKKPRTDINPDEVVAVGAAIQALALARSSAGAAAPVSSVLLDVTPRALGIAVVGGFADTIIARNAQIPVEQTRMFTTSQDGQQTVRIQVCQGESRVFAENQALGELVLDGLRAAPRGQLNIAVSFEIDTNGMLQVSAVDRETGRQQNAKVRIHGAVDEERIAELQQRQDQMPAPQDVEPADS